jgi:hypothetical protein
LQHPLNRRRYEAIVASELDHPQAVRGEEDIVLSPELVGRPGGAGYKEAAAGGKAAKRNFAESAEGLRCCRDRFRPCTKNSVNSKEP